jgi:hypothetical protein
MQGSVASYFNQQQNTAHSHDILYYFTPDKLPVLTTLATQYAVFNRWFASIPGPTICNRAFAHYGTSFGQVSMDVFYEGKPFEGSVSLRMLFTGSVANAGNTVPYYFDPTVGGSDIGGNPLLPSYPDYRFRAPDLVLLLGAVEHALPNILFGVYFSADAAKSALTRSDIDFTNLRRSYSIGLTVHAGGLPVVYLLFAWGGNEGTHTTFSVSNALLGASQRPSLF